MIEQYNNTNIYTESVKSANPTKDLAKSDFSSLDSIQKDHNSKRSTSSPNSPQELSSYSITPIGDLLELFTSTEYLYSRVIEISNNFMLLECIIDYNDLKYDIRKIERSLIPNELQSLNKIICIKISKRPGKFVSEFYEASDLGSSKYFEIDENIYNDLDTGSAIKI